MSRARVMLSFQPDNPRHMKAYAALMSMPPGTRSEYAAEMINRGVDMEQFVYAAVVRALQEYSPNIAKEPMNGETGQIPQDMLDFVFSL